MTHLRDAEIAQLDVAVLVEQEVLWLDIKTRHAVAVKVLQSEEEAAHL